MAPTLPPVVVCSVIEATCMNGQCIDKDKVCDGVYDCDDASDEMRCSKLTGFLHELSKCDYHPFHLINFSSRSISLLLRYML